MIQAVTFCIEMELLEQARLQVREENRTLTNLIETRLKRPIVEAKVGSSSSAAAERASDHQLCPPQQPA